MLYKSIAFAIIFLLAGSCEKIIVNNTDGDNNDNTPTYEDSKDYVWDANSVIDITLTGNSAYCKSGSVSVKGSTVTITSAGNYRIGGPLSEEQNIVNSEDAECTKVAKLLLLHLTTVHTISYQQMILLMAPKACVRK